MVTRRHADRIRLAKRRRRSADEQAIDFWESDPDTKAERRVTDLSGRRGALGESALATDGDYIYFTGTEHTGDIWVADVVDPD